MRGLIEASAKSLNQAKMIRFIEHTGTLHSTDLGRTASHYYINTASIEVCIHRVYVYIYSGGTSLIRNTIGPPD